MHVLRQLVVVLEGRAAGMFVWIEGFCQIRVSD